MEKEPLVRVAKLKKHFSVKKGILKRKEQFVKAVDDVSFEISKGENLALVGESGCGKTTTARLILRLLDPTSGSISFAGKDLFDLTEEELRLIRPQLQLVFQDPYASLNPRKTIKQILGKPFSLHTDLTKEKIEDEVLRLLEIVGLSPPALFVDRHPHEFSGGQRQRICIARAIALNPSLVVADEPVSALDVSVRAQILNLLKDLQTRLGITYLLITHDLAVVRSVSNRVAVMYLGKLVEVGEVSELFKEPLHPYTEALLSATPIPDPEKSRSREKMILRGDVPSPIDPPPGCRFHTRCPLAMEKCRKLEPQLAGIKGGLVACHLRA
ncbi:dipeptide ABC transporter ATP-binding protein [Candidatus Bathyarchaeota archaeon]|nr:dipeptide ABC transporter ATP-binding protein [Candidatus Bathyarchaeota archaeon]